MLRKTCWIHHEGDGVGTQRILHHAPVEHAQSTLADDCDARLSHPKSFLQRMFRIKGIVAHPLSAAGSQPGNKRKRTDTCPAWAECILSFELDTGIFLSS